MIELSNTLKLLKVFLFLLPLGSLSVSGSESHDEVKAEIRALLSPLVDEQLLPGYYVAVYDGEAMLFDEKQGLANETNDLKPGADVLYAVMSMSKPVITFAALRLVESGDLNLDDPVSKYLPEFKTLSVVEDGDLDNPHVDLTRPITLHDLLTHTSGFTYSQDVTGREEVAELYSELRIFPIDERDSPGLESLSDHVAALAQLPLVSQPGERFVYSVSIDVLGRVLEVAAKKSLSEVIDEQVLQPLKMDSTFFFVPDEERHRLAQMFRPRVATYPIPGNYRRYQAYEFETGAPNFGLYEQQFLSGGAGLISSASDYSKFLRMLMNHGFSEQGQIASSKTVALMFKNQLPAHLGGNGLVYNFGPNALGAGFGYGLGIRTVDEGNPVDSSDHDYYFWSGAANTGFWIDRKSGLIGIFMAQHLPTQYDRVPELVEITRALVD